MARKSLAIIGFLLTACSLKSDLPGRDISSSSDAPNVGLRVVQNSSAAKDLLYGLADGVTITQNPSYALVSVDGTEVTYRTTDPLYSGTDEFKYKLTYGSDLSNEATVTVTITPLTSGVTTYTENYSGGAYDLSGWQSYTSTFAHTVSSTTGFSTATYNSVLRTSRNFAVYGNITSYAGDDTYNGLFSTLPVDGTGGAMLDWPWKAELIHLPECGADAEINMKLVGKAGTYPMVGVLLNYDIEDAGTSSQKLTGYQVLVNSGGSSMTLSRFNGANELATAYLDRWPGHATLESGVNPVTSGPYKGWNYKSAGVWPAGGHAGSTVAINIAIHYQYDNITDTTTIGYEPRAINGTDGSPGVYDQVVTLTGGDSLRTGGKFGLMPMNYHTPGYVQPTNFDIVEFKAVCTLP